MKEEEKNIERNKYITICYDCGKIISNIYERRYVPFYKKDYDYKGKEPEKVVCIECYVKYPIYTGF